MEELNIEHGFIFWPVGTGDSTTIRVDAETHIQVDLHHMEKSKDDDNDCVAVIDELIQVLPTKYDRPYLSVFALTHPDEDHIKGFSELLEQVDIGEIWFTPRVFREYVKDLCDDAVVFKGEAERRLENTIANAGVVASGNRIRIIGYDTLLQEPEFSGLPLDLLTVPGNWVTAIDGIDQGHQFSAFIHAPFKADAEAERNDTSLAMQVTLNPNGNPVKALLFGDLKYASLRRIFDESSANGNLAELQWNILLAPHHCSKSAMYVKNENTGNYILQQDIMDNLDSVALEPGYIVSSSMPIPAGNSPGDNPPHTLAKNQYNLIVPNEFICTHENPLGDTKPLVIDAIGPDHIGTSAQTDGQSALGLAAAIDDARGSPEPPSEKAGFGKCR